MAVALGMTVDEARGGLAEILGFNCEAFDTGPVIAGAEAALIELGGDRAWIKRRDNTRS